jgi:four helix bundle protein
VKTFEELYCYQKAVEVRKKISVLVKTLPGDEKYRLVDQMIRASRSTPAQIAEGYGRYHYQENVQYCRQGRGSLYELVDHLTVAKEENYISEDSWNTLREEILECITTLNGYINYLIKAKSESGKVEEPLSVYGEIPIND